MGARYKCFVFLILIYLLIFHQIHIFRVLKLVIFLKARPTKTIRGLVKMLEISERTVFRYMDLVKDLGFRIEKNISGRFWLASSGATEFLPFTPQKFNFLEKLIKSSGKRSRLGKSILLKLIKLDMVHAGADHLFNVQLSQIINLISVTIVEKRQLLIKH